MLKRRPALFPVTIFVGVVSALVASSATAQELPEKVVEALQRNAAALNPIEISWEQTRSSRLTLDRVLALVEQPQEKAFFHPEDFTVVLQGRAFSCFRKYTQWDIKEEHFFTWHRDVRYDGSALYYGNSMNVKPLISIEDLDYAREHYPDTTYFDAAYLTAAGFKVHSLSTTIGQPPESELLYLVEGGREVTSVSDVAGSLLSVNVTTEQGETRFFLNPARQYAVQKIEKYNGEGALTQTTTNDRFVKLGSSQAWLPKHCRVSDYTWWSISETISPDPIVHTDFVVQELNQDRSQPDQFVISKRPGMTVSDARPEAATEPGARRNADGRYVYRIVPTPEDIAQAVGVSKGRRRTVLLLSTLVVVVVMGILVVRKRRLVSVQ